MMPIMRIVKHEKPYVQIDKTALNDAQLSFMAKGIYAYLMSKPNDWRINLKHLENTSPNEGRRAVRKALQELQHAGYLTRRLIRSDDGRLHGWNFELYETPLLAEIATEDSVIIGENDSSPNDRLRTDGRRTDGRRTDGKRSSTNKEAVTQNRAVLTNEKDFRAREKSEKDEGHDHDTEEPHSVPIDEVHALVEAFVGTHSPEPPRRRGLPVHANAEGEIEDEERLARGRARKTMLQAQAAQLATGET